MKPTIDSLPVLDAALLSLSDPAYRDFQARLMPTVDKNKILGIRVPHLRKLSKEVAPQTAEAFLARLPHRYYDEDNLHAFLIERIGDFDATLRALDAFLPYVDNWATCDTMRPKCLAKQPARLLEKIEEWLASPHTYTVRYGIGLLMTHFLNSAYSPEIPARVAAITSQEYYIRMMCAWFFATSLIDHPDDILPYLTEGRLDPTVHRMTVRKALDSYRIPPAMKAFLKSISPL